MEGNSTFGIHPAHFIILNMKTTLLFVFSCAAPILCGLLPRLNPRVDDTPWRDITCDHGSLSDAKNNPFDLWNDAKATQAFAECYDAFKKDTSGIGFSNFAANCFHSRPGINCGQLDNPNCEVAVACGQNDAPNAEVNSPAG